LICATTPKWNLFIADILLSHPSSAKQSDLTKQTKDSDGEAIYRGHYAIGEPTGQAFFS
jgi:hypothetical protein